MAAITFDSLAYSKHLQKAGMPAEQADALAELAKQHDDLIATRASMDVATTSDVAEVRLEIEKLRAETKAMETRLLKWQVGIAVAMLTIMAKGFGWLGF